MSAANTPQNLDMQTFLKRSQAVQAAIKNVQDTLAKQVVEGSDPSGSVTAVANGQCMVTGIRIKPETFGRTTPQAFAAQVLAAIQDAQAKARTLAEGQLKAASEKLEAADPLTP